MTGGHKPMRLPPLRVLRVRNPKSKVENPCIAVMSTVLACWASSGYNTAGCAAIEQQLRKCMDAPPAPPPRGSGINHHLSRFQDYIASPRRR